MARPHKKELFYFNLDVAFYRDIKIRMLLRYTGGPSALGVLIAIFSRIYESGYYLEWNNEQCFTISTDIFSEDRYVAEIVEKCLEYDIFDKKLYEEHHILTSHDIQERYLNATIRRIEKPTKYIYNDLIKKPKMHTETELLHTETELLHTETELLHTETELLHTETELLHTESTQIKGNKRKEKDIPPISPQGGMGDSPSGGSDLNDAGAAEEVPDAEVVSSNPVGYEKFDLSFVCDELREPFFRWLDYKRVDQRFKYKSVTSIKTCYNSLVKFSRSDPAKAMLIVEQSITNGWKGMFNSNMNNNGTGQQLTAQQRIEAELERGAEYARGILARNDASIRDGVPAKVW